MSIELKLKSLTARVSRTINGQNVIKLEDNAYLINGERFTLKEGVSKLVSEEEVQEENSSLSSNNKSTNFDKVVYIMIEPPFRVISTHRIQSDEERIKLINDSIKKGLLLYFTDIRARDGKYYAAQPWLIEWASVPNDMSGRSKTAKKYIESDKNIEKQVINPEEQSSSLKCPYCNKVLNSKFGRTNHVKGKHQDKLAEYLENYG